MGNIALQTILVIPWAIEIYLIGYTSPNRIYRIYIVS